MLSCEFFEIFKNTFLEERLWGTASICYRTTFLQHYHYLKECLKADDINVTRNHLLSSRLHPCWNPFIQNMLPAFLCF